MSATLALPSRACGCGFDVLQLNGFVWYLSHLEASFTAVVTIVCYIRVRSKEVQLGGELHNFVVEVSIPGNLPANAPIFNVSSNISKELGLSEWQVTGPGEVGSFYRSTLLE
jgi:hypothetical protein